MSTPPIYAKGVFEAATPFVIPSNVSYTCVAIRSFREVKSEGIDVYAAFYEAYGIAKDKYEQDEVNAVSIITLFGDDRPAIRLPSSYITSYPLTTNSGYSRLVLGIDVGIFPDNFDLTYLKTELAGLIESITGLSSEVTENYAPFSGVITPEQAQAFEDNRAAAIQGRATYFAKLEQLQSQLDTANLVKAKYEEILLANNLIPN